MSKLLSFEFLDETFESIGEVLAGMKESRLRSVDLALNDIEIATSHIPETPVNISAPKEQVAEVVDLNEYRINQIADTEKKLGSDVLQSLSQEDRLAEARALLKDMAA